MQSVSPVFTDAEVPMEREVATDSKYISVIGLPVTLQILDRENPEVKKEVPNWAVSIRFRLSPEERAQIAAGLDLVVTQLTFGKPLAPMNLQLCPAKTKPVFEITPEPPVPQVEDEDIPSPAEGGPDSNERPYMHEWEPYFSEGEPSKDSKTCGICGRDDNRYHEKRYGSEGQLRILTHCPACNDQSEASDGIHVNGTLEHPLPSAADLDAVAAEQEAANPSPHLFQAMEDDAEYCSICGHSVLHEKHETQTEQPAPAEDQPQ